MISGLSLNTTRDMILTGHSNGFILFIDFHAKDDTVMKQSRKTLSEHLMLNGHKEMLTLVQNKDVAAYLISDEEQAKTILELTNTFKYMCTTKLIKHNNSQ